MLVPTGCILMNDFMDSGRWVCGVFLQPCSWMEEAESAGQKALSGVMSSSSKVSFPSRWAYARILSLKLAQFPHCLWMKLLEVLRYHARSIYNKTRELLQDLMEAFRSIAPNPLPSLNVSIRFSRPHAVSVSETNLSMVDPSQICSAPG